MLSTLSCETALILYHFPSGLSSTFSKFLLEIFLFLSTASQDSFNIISQIISFVNTFSEIFSICFFRPPLRPYASNAAPAVLLFCVSPSRRLIYYSRFTANCQLKEYAAFPSYFGHICQSSSKLAEPPPSDYKKHRHY